ncbi:MAG: tRNA (N(6)-L-threonylcarbamoyladenosine(37)-C(2))-methylthiotransferase MtaB [Candidatus Omnitrophica bacterium]|nr:tRNA (N(6)-L-threonylcarbamoyladenosine(37)-C(2))-methylthiotransferase MtaB [Candidatus Omnitrophota bacterium]
MKRVLFKTLGCKVNQYETQAMREQFLRAGYNETAIAQEADVCIVNTCTVTHTSDRECRRIIRQLHRRNRLAKIVVTGCYTEKDAEIIATIEGVTQIIPNQDKDRIAQLLDEDGSCSNHADESLYSPLKITDFAGHDKAFVKIQDGCDHRCSYCKVPLVRGPSRSRPLDDILDEVKVLVSNGFQEIILTGICLGAWGRDLHKRRELSDAVEAITHIDGHFRVRLSSIEPNHVSKRLIEMLKVEKKLCGHLHIPLQSGADEVLRRMKRPYTASKYESLVDELRRQDRDFSLTTDLLVGFPGEGESHFQETLNLVRRIEPCRVHIFTYSPRPGTEAADIPSKNNPRVLKRRQDELRAVVDEASYKYRRRFVDETLEVLIEDKTGGGGSLKGGYSDRYINVLVHGVDGHEGRLCDVKIRDVTSSYTIGDVVSEKEIKKEATGLLYA